MRVTHSGTGVCPPTALPHQGGCYRRHISTEFHVLGPVEALIDGRRLRLGGPRPRAVLTVLLLHAGQVVPAARIIDEVWAEFPPDTAANVLQGYVSQLRKVLGRDAIETREPGYVLRVEHDASDLHRFERFASDGTELLERGQAEDAAALLREALALWRGPALADLADEGMLLATAARLDELRLVALERRIQADLARARHAEIVGELETLVAEHPLRERPRALQMLALYRCGRQAEALAAYRAARDTLVEQLGIEPGAPLQELERAILRHDPSLDLEPGRHHDAQLGSDTILVAALDLGAADALVAIVEPLARVGDRRELVLATTVTNPEELASASAHLKVRRDGLLRRGVSARAAAFTSLAPGIDFARLATEQDAGLVVVDAPNRLLEDGRLLTLLDDAPCNVAVLVRGEPEGDAVIVPFTGAEHDWSAVELGVWFSLGTAAPLRLAGSKTSVDTGGDASRLLASASLAVQRAFGVHAEPLLVEPTAQALVEATREAALVVVGLTDRWRREGVGQVRTALAASPHHPTLLVRSGLRSGGLTPRSAQTHFTWTIGPGVL
jgi:DNA-binding SARP family transcriptional activator